MITKREGKNDFPHHPLSKLPNIDKMALSLCLFILVTHSKLLINSGHVGCVGHLFENEEKKKRRVENK
jgi:hypothetical protein